jgi:tRNA threonylcarbamoyladenosine biosynthesis protein TsaB
VVIVLGIDTATPALSCALVGPEGTMARFVAEEGRRHTELLAPAIERICAEAGITLAAVDLVAADVGPGLFTGLRVGLATAAALASALGRPATGLASTEILAAPHLGDGRTVVAVVDIRRGEVAWGRYGAEGAAGPALAAPEALAGELDALTREAGDLLVVGDGALRYRDVLVPAGSRLALDVSAPYPSAEVLAGLAWRRCFGGASGPDLTPLYLRQADVRIGWATREQPASAAPAETRS